MSSQISSGRLGGRGLLLLPVLGLCGLFLQSAQGAKPAPQAGKQNQRAVDPLAKKPVAAPAPRSALLQAEDWQRASMTAILPGEIDRLVSAELTGVNVTPAALTTDEQFIRRVSLDFLGALPVPADVTEFVANTDPAKRAKLIERLLDSDEFAQHWARYWRDVVTARITDVRFGGAADGFEAWLSQQFKRNQSWGDITRAIITASGEMNFDEPEKNGAAFFLAAHRGPEAENEQAAETARVFMGIRIQCAQCHDHPSDQWKRVQFHEFAGYFARNKGRVQKQQKQFSLELASLPRGEHEMPSKEDPKKTFLTHPRFLDGHAPGVNLADLARRRSLADDIIDRKDYWFGAAFVNRIWGELMGQSFYEPVDDLGPQKTAVFPAVLTRVTGAFRGTNYDVKGLFRAIALSDTYQRQIRPGQTAEEHLHFAAAYPTRLRADALWESLENVLGKFGQQRGDGPKGPLAKIYNRFQGLEGIFKLEFDFDPSLKADEVEGSIPQALMMMNNAAINQRIRAEGKTLLGRLLTAYPDNDEAVRALYLRALARKPTDREASTCRSYLASTPTRAAGFEDLLWALLNSTEFQTKR